MLQLNNISTHIDRIAVLRDITTELPKGALVAIVGRNGAGKTTLLRSIMGLIRPSAGTIVLETNDLSRRPAYQRAHFGIGYAPQERIIFPSMSVKENITFPGQIIRLPKTTITERLEFIRELIPQLSQLSMRSGAALSGGQGKIVALGRALMTGTRLLLLDEPLQGLAPALALDYQTTLKRLHQVRPDLCIVITESNASLLKTLPTKILRLERGALLV